MQLVVNYSLVIIFSMVVGANCLTLIPANFEDASTAVSIFECLEEGRFPFPIGLGGYVECVRNPEGIFRRRFGSCHGALFNPKRKTCMTSFEDLGGERPVRIARALVTDQKYSSLCSQIQDGFVCANCKTAVTCVDGKPHVETCGSFDICAEKQEFGGAVCYPASNDTCSCSSAYDFFIDAYDDQAFFFCSEAGADPDLYHCPDDMIFNGITRQCHNLNGMPHCTEAGVFPYYDDCSLYYACIAISDEGDGWVQKTFSCESSLMYYNQDSGNCEDPCTWKMGKFACQAEGLFSDPLSCNHYFECVEDDTGHFHQEYRQCPEGYQWDNSAFSDPGRCVTDSASNCTTVKVSKCVIPQHCAEYSSSSIHDQELKEKIEAMKKTKADKEKEIEEKMLLVDAMYSLLRPLIYLYLAVGVNSPHLMAPLDSFPNVSVTADTNGFVTISPYCSLNGQDVARGTPQDILMDIIDDIQRVLTSRLDLTYCMTSVVLRLSYAVHNELIIVHKNTIDYHVSMEQLFEFASRKIEEIEAHIVNLKMEKYFIDSDLLKLEDELNASNKRIDEPKICCD